MAKYSGKVGYVFQVETAPDVFTPQSTERVMRGDVIGLNVRFESSEKVNDDFSLGHRLSLMGDPYAYGNIANIRYVSYMGYNWKVLSAVIQRPRIIVTLGGLWNAT